MFCQSDTITYLANLRSSVQPFYFDSLVLSARRAISVGHFEELVSFSLRSMMER